MNENMFREMAKRCAIIIGVISITLFILSFLAISEFPFGLRSESALLAIGSMLLYTEIQILNVTSKTYKTTLLLYLIVSLILRFVGEAQLVVSPFITWGHIILCLLCLFWITRKNKQNNVTS